MSSLWIDDDRNFLNTRRDNISAGLEHGLLRTYLHDGSIRLLLLKQAKYFVFVAVVGARSSRPVAWAGRPCPYEIINQGRMCPRTDTRSPFELFIRMYVIARRALARRNNLTFSGRISSIMVNRLRGDCFSKIAMTELNLNGFFVTSWIRKWKEAKKTII